MANEFSRSLDEQIRRAIEEGQFDDLPGKGKPLDLSQNPYEDPSWRMAFNMLRSSGYTLPWIETRKEIEADFEEVYNSLARSWAWRGLALEQNQPYTLVEDEWQRALIFFREKIKSLNKRIFVYNLKVPSDQFKRQIINPDVEIARITSQPD
jgi:DnaJ family protein C protein 28